MRLLAWLLAAWLLPPLHAALIIHDVIYGEAAGETLRLDVHVIQQSRNFRERMRSNNLTCELFVLPGAGHRRDNWSDFDPAHASNMIAWVRDALASHPATVTGR